MMEVLFWISAVCVFYVYLGYPMLLVVWRRVASRPVGKADYEPAVSIVIAAHNERDRLERKLENCLALDYPRRKLQIIVSLDGPTDGSEFQVWKYASRGVELVHSREHSGKAAALNRALRRATGEVVVFADARQTFNAKAIRELTANFADEGVGAVTGELVLMDADRQEARSDVGLYWRYEKALRGMESEIHSIAGATGAIYAIRRELYEELPTDAILDDVLTPLRIVLKGKRVVFEPEAKAYDEAACCPRAEYGRKVRTLCGNYQLLAYLPQTLAPWRNPIFIQFISHKVGRLAAPWALLMLFFANAFMLHGFYAATFTLQIAWYAFAFAGYVLARREVFTPASVPNEGRRAA
jgi:cellulose synthase/poly-beta-1,6-N-acetylglucosamine synthase-like glycosyltransferase